MSFLVELLVGAVKELDTIAADHHENMLALVDDFKLLALFLVERTGWSSRAAGTKTLYQWLHGGYMTSQKRQSPAQWLG